MLQKLLAKFLIPEIIIDNISYKNIIPISMNDIIKYIICSGLIIANAKNTQFNQDSIAVGNSLRYILFHLQSIIYFQFDNTKSLFLDYAYYYKK